MSENLSDRELEAALDSQRTAIIAKGGLSSKEGRSRVQAIDIVLGTLRSATASSQSKEMARADGRRIIDNPLLL